MSARPDASGSTPWTLQDDLQAVAERCGKSFEKLRGRRLFITGGTGFIGRWMLESLRWADEALELGVAATILTRDPAAFARKAPHLTSYPAFEFVAGDVMSFTAPPGRYSHVIHAATDASAHLNEHDPRRMFETVVAGTRRALDFAVEQQAERVLYLSSGAVYGRQPWEMERVPEHWVGAPDCTQPVNAYGEGKRAAEMLCAIYAKQFGLQISTARIFALLGPLLTLDIHFAAGNFIRDAMAGRPVIVRGDGRPVRSYLYAADLTAWLWTLLTEAEAGKAYNVGSDQGVSIRELAERVSRVIGCGEFRVLGEADSGWNPGRYVPDTTLAGTDLGLYSNVSLDDAIRRTALWNGWGA
jgi:dTDP-glucose 4,6-dehydratase